MRTKVNAGIEAYTVNVQSLLVKCERERALAKRFVNKLLEIGAFFQVTL